MHMANRHRQRVSRIMGRRQLGKSEQQPDHVLNLLLVGTPIANDGALDFRWSVLDDRAACLDRREHGDAACMSQLDGRTDVGGVEECFDGHAVGRATLQSRREFSMNAPQAMGE